MSPAVIENPTVALNGTPAFDYISAYESIFSAKTSQESLDAALALCNGIAAEPSTAHHVLIDLLPKIAKAAGDKKSGTNRESAMIVYGAFYETLPKKAPTTEVLLVETVGIVFDALADKGAVVRESAQYAIDAILATLSQPALVSGLLRTLMAYLRSSGSKWQGKQAAFILIGKMADKAVKAEQTSGEVFLKDVMGRELEALIPVVESGMHDLKDTVSKTAVKTTNSLTKLLSNDDIAKHITTLVATMNMPSKETLTKAIHALSQTTFVQTVTSPVLSLLTPLLERALNSPQTSQEVLRQTVVVTENLTKLVHDPIEAREFLPRLQPGVKRVLETASIPAVRELAKSANDVMVKAMRLSNGDEESALGERISAAEVDGELSIRAAPLMRKEEQSVWETKVKPYVVAMAREVIVIREWSRLAGCITPYLKDLVGEEGANSIAEAVEKWAKETDHARFGNIGIVDAEYANEVEIVNAQFSLAYGGMMLLNHTNLRLHKGHRYGLCGRNGAGKSTLMRSIAEGKLEGFPSKDQLRTCFVEHRSQGDENALPIVEYIRNSLIADNLAEGFLDEDGTEKIKETLRSVGFEGERVDFKVGELSGGWKMKLALAEAMLKKAEVLLLDEPTNHLDVGNVKWLENYLKTHTEITSLIVSHDSGFLDEVCTDIIHYENKKLAYYKGNLAAYVHSFFTVSG
jgi:elongation factor 3